MTDYIKHKEYKLPNGRTVTADFNELGCAMVTIQAMDALFDILNSSDAVEVVRCKDCKLWNDVELQVDGTNHKCWGGCEFWKYQTDANDYCSYGERADT